MKLAYNEMVQLWGSLAEGGFYYSGVSKNWMKNHSNGLNEKLRELLLFDIPCPEFL
jgi:hypothetical protein